MLICLPSEFLSRLNPFYEDCILKGNKTKGGSDDHHLAGYIFEVENSTETLNLLIQQMQ